MQNEPFHAGEIAVQERAGEREIARRRGSIVSPRIIPGALEFLAQQEFLALSVAGDDGHLWTSVWCGQSGFVQSVDGTNVDIRPSRMATSPDDPVFGRLAVGRDVGILAIEFASRRRLRINGTVDRLTADAIGVRVRESVPNCPKYIQRRERHEAQPAPVGRTVRQSGGRLDAERRALVERADTAFVGSLHPARGVDASHRGGARGFIHVIDETTLRIPDYPGNSMFLTLGNYAIDPRASLAALDFERGLILCCSGSARLQFGAEHPEHPTSGTGRYWELTIREWVQFALTPLMRWALLEASPFNPAARRK
jgi:predicted pyridoxine 5'-phosphate oxidase superfamily flavin-nucleotide-binding protein